MTSNEWFFIATMLASGTCVSMGMVASAWAHRIRQGADRAGRCEDTLDEDLAL